MTRPCTICGKPTEYTGTGLCDPCWNTKYQVEDNPDLAKIMYHISPERLAFESEKGVHTGPWYQGQVNANVMLVVIWARLLQIPIEQARRGSGYDWQPVSDDSFNFRDYQFRKARPQTNNDKFMEGVKCAAVFSSF